jgi:hypothetical protein
MTSVFRGNKDPETIVYQYFFGKGGEHRDIIRRFLKKNLSKNQRNNLEEKQKFIIRNQDEVERLEMIATIRSCNCTKLYGILIRMYNFIVVRNCFRGGFWLDESSLEKKHYGFFGEKPFRYTLSNFPDDVLAHIGSFLDPKEISDPCQRRWSENYHYGHLDRDIGLLMRGYLVYEVPFLSFRSLGGISMKKTLLRFCVITGKTYKERCKRLFNLSPVYYKNILKNPEDRLNFLFPTSHKQIKALQKEDFDLDAFYDSVIDKVFVKETNMFVYDTYANKSIVTIVKQHNEYVKELKKYPRYSTVYQERTNFLERKTRDYRNKISRMINGKEKWPSVVDDFPYPIEEEIPVKESKFTFIIPKKTEKKEKVFDTSFMREQQRKAQNERSKANNKKKQEKQEKLKVCQKRKKVKTDGKKKNRRR